MKEIPPLVSFSINKYWSMSDIFSNFTPVIFNIASQDNPRELNNDTGQVHNILSKYQ